MKNTNMYHKFMELLVIERPYSSKILLALSALSMGVILQFPDSKDDSITNDLQLLASLEVWFILLWLYGLTLLYGIFANNTTAKILASLVGIVLWTGLTIFHASLSNIDVLFGIYMIFAFFSLWHTLVVYEQIRIFRKHKIDMTKMANDMMVQFLKRYRK